MGPPPCSLKPLNLGPDSHSRAGHISGFPIYLWPQARQRGSTEETDITHTAYKPLRPGNHQRSSPELRPYRAGAPVRVGLHPRVQEESKGWAARQASGEDERDCGRASESWRDVVGWRVGCDENRFSTRGSCVRGSRSTVPGL